ncbi:hypothetical protein BDY24DRAFT_414132 [Mrakia frigida]|uniref:uncharacterized protein n=1 Tax=Mrakia frigida TaxID=29902 RepID=UPI003FCBFFFF
MFTLSGFLPPSRTDSFFLSTSSDSRKPILSTPLSFRARLLPLDLTRGHGYGAWNPPNPRLFQSVGVVFSTLPASLPPAANQIFRGRSIFFAQPRSSTDRPAGGHPQLVLASMEIARRLGGTIASRVERADWIVVGTRKGKTYAYGLGQPKKVILGSLNHFFAHLNTSITEIIDVRSNLLHFPHPVLSGSNPGPLKNVDIFISQRYPQKYRTYLQDLARAQGADLLEFASYLRHTETALLISPTQREHRSKTDGHAGRLSPSTTSTAVAEEK